MSDDFVFNEEAKVHLSQKGRTWADLNAHVITEDFGEEFSFLFTINFRCGKGSIAKAVHTTPVRGVKVEERGGLQPTCLIHESGKSSTVFKPKI
ncbi:hypothetical protein CDAR_535731 [Caerostris darwini]|uniref:Uncharacterized protein n=1 Tax=Caerostris darwini TaxID=1538125 RepID=A0AAV4QTH3_9ARAC|nr:hypothetical protein CDAR_535731 [Caerostris darwini]